VLCASAPWPVWALERCRISPPRFLVKCRKKQLNRGGFVLHRLLFLDCFVCLLSVQGGPKNLAQFLLNVLTLSNINRFSKFFHCQNQEKICNNIITKDPTTPQVCRYTTLWNVSVLKATIENKTTSVTTHFKKVATGNKAFNKTANFFGPPCICNLSSVLYFPWLALCSVIVLMSRVTCR